MHSGRPRPTKVNTSPHDTLHEPYKALEKPPALLITITYCQKMAPPSEARRIESNSRDKITGASRLPSKDAESGALASRRKALLSLADAHKLQLAEAPVSSTDHRPSKAAQQKIDEINRHVHALRQAVERKKTVKAEDMVYHELMEQEHYYKLLLAMAREPAPQNVQHQLM